MELALSTAEIAKILNWNVNTVHVTVCEIKRL
ncbi:MAG: hypothetical protein LBS77_01435 [Desulfovibrio sp.]|nr:hypothetical protein [Desulfovibrio sp.]